MTAHVNWREAAACRDTDPDLFFPVSTAGPGLRQIEEAKRICRVCPVRTVCLAWALDHEVGPGVWGGTTEAERRALRPPSERNRPSARATAVPANDQGRENRAYVRKLLRQKQPAFAVALEWAVMLVERELHGVPGGGQSVPPAGSIGAFQRPGPARADHPRLGDLTSALRARTLREEGESHGRTL